MAGSPPPSPWRNPNLYPVPSTVSGEEAHPLEPSPPRSPLNLYSVPSTAPGEEAHPREPSPPRSLVAVADAEEARSLDVSATSESNPTRVAVADSEEARSLDDSATSESNPSWVAVADTEEARSLDDSATSESNTTPLFLPPPEAVVKFGPPSLNSLLFNQDFGCFSASTSRGFRIYSCDPFREIFRRNFDDCGIGIAEMLFRSNILALVGSGGGEDVQQPRFPPNKILIWDDNHSRYNHVLSFRSDVRAVRLRRDRIVAVLDHRIIIYNFEDLKKPVGDIETGPNPKGLCAVTHQQGLFVLVCPGTQKGQVRVEHYGVKRTRFIMAHDSRLSSIALSQDGRLLATASSKGTLVRVFSTVDGTLLQEVRRGADRADIYCLTFSPDMQWLAVSSDKGTIHVFSLKINLGLTKNDRPRPALEPSNSSSNLSLLKGVLPKYFSSEWSVAKFRLQEGWKYYVAFGHQKHTVIVIGTDGSFYRCQFDPVNGGEMKPLECHNFLKPEETF